MIGDVILGVSVVLVFRIGMLFLDGCDLGMANAFDLMTVRQMGMMGGADMIVMRIGLGGLQVFVGGDGEVVGCLAVVIGGVVVQFVFTLGDHGHSPGSSIYRGSAVINAGGQHDPRVPGPRVRGKRLTTCTS
jgi:hypothetical protein